MNKEFIKFKHDIQNGIKPSRWFGYFEQHGISAQELSDLALSYYQSLTFNSNNNLDRDDYYELMRFILKLSPEQMNVGDLLVDYNFDLYNYKHKILVNYWIEHLADKGIQTELDMKICSNVLSSLHKHENVSKTFLEAAMTMNVDTIATSLFENLSSDAARKVIGNIKLAPYIENKLDVDKLNKDELFTILNTNSTWGVIQTPGYSEDFLKRCFYRCMDTLEPEKLYMNLHAFLPQTKNKKIIDTPLTKTIACYALWHTNKNKKLHLWYMGQYHEGTKRLPDCLPGIGSQKGQVLLKNTYFPSFNAISKLESLYSDSDIIKIANIGNNVEVDADISSLNL